MPKEGRDNKGKFVKGNKIGEVHSLEKVLPIFEELVAKCHSGEYLSIQECQINSGIPRKSFYELCDRHPELRNLKDEMNDSIISNINSQALKGKFNVVAAIWRMKNLGEKETTTVDLNVKEKPLFKLD